MPPETARPSKMLPELATVLKLQDRDQAIRRIGLLLARIPVDEAKAKSRLEHDQKQVADCKTAIQENEMAMKNLELDIDTRKQSITRLKVQQFETKKNEEFRAIGHEIVRYTEDVSNLETSELELMEKGDGLKANLAAAKESLDATQILVDEELVKLAERKKVSEEQIAALEAERKEIAVGVDEDLLSIYERLFKGKGDVAVAPIIAGKCQGCHMSVTQSTQNQAKAGKEITHCEQCSRIVYLGEEH